MSDANESEIRPMQSSERHESRSGIECAIGRKERRRLRARESGDRSVWFGLGMFGVIGWSVAVPTVAGIAAGLWIDSRFETERSWTLMLMVAGLGVGCVNAWAWIHRETAADDSVDSAQDGENSE